jgi:nucleoside-diphosphate kinase
MSTTARRLKEEKTFVLIKPDGVQKGLIGEIINRFERRDLKIVALEMFMPTHEMIDNHYPKSEAWIARLGEKTLSTYAKYNIDAKTEIGTDVPLEIGKQVRNWLMEFMTSAPLVRIVVQGVHAVDMVRKIAGPTLPYMADSPAIANSEQRAVHNIVHASETPEEALHEIQHWFGDTTRVFSYKRHGISE